MPPHCDALDGPVVKAAARALDINNVQLVLPFVHKADEEEIRKAFEQVVRVREADGALTRDLADRYFFETVVRVHRAGEGAAYTGLKPAGLDPGPVIPVAERAIDSGSAHELSDLLCDAVRAGVKRRFDQLLELQEELEESGADGVEESREYVEAMLEFEVYAHHLYRCIMRGPHEPDRDG